jgi:hypothetical protein
MESVLDMALFYQRQGLSVIPVIPRSKTPCVPWQEFQETKASEDTIRRWHQKYFNFNLGIVTGRISNIIVVDVDSKLTPYSNDVDYALRYIATYTQPAVRTNQGYHLYFKHPDDQIIGNRTNVIPKVDIRGDGGYVVAPPSIHSSGFRYAWTNSIPVSKAPKLPQCLLELCLTESSAPTQKSNVVFEVKVKSRSRDITHTVKLMSSGFWTCTCEAFKLAHNDNCAHIKDGKQQYQLQQERR